MDTDSFGSCLRRAREKRQLTLREVAGATKIPRTTLESIEAGNLDELPADVFVRGFIRSYARLVGTDEAEPLHNFERALNARRDAERAVSSTPVVPEPAAPATVPSVASGPIEDDGTRPRRGGLGLAVFVIILLLIATITLSLLLRRPPPSGEGLSDATSRSETESALPRAETESALPRAKMIEGADRAAI
jgi:cytoskeletal protein RodZ